MLGFSVDRDRCLRDGLCLSACNRGILLDDGEGCPVIDEKQFANCNACGHCSAVCPVHALTSPHSGGEAAIPLDPQLSFDFASAKQFLLSCRSIRRFKDQEVPKKEILELLDVARKAPSGSNRQPVRWLVVSGKEKMRRISALVVEWFDTVVRHNPSLCAGYNVDYITGRYKEGYDIIMRGAPNAAFAITDAADKRGAVDASIALTYFCLAAHGKNIGSCWAGFAMRACEHHAPLREYLGLDASSAAQAIAFFGYPNITYHGIPPRRPLNVAWL